jgi:hypothetical protein
MRFEVENDIFRGLYEFVLGAFLLSELTVHKRHLTNIVHFWYAERSEGVKGRIIISHWLAYKVSAVEFLLFGVLFAIIFGLTGRVFFAGGALRCTSMGGDHLKYAKAWRKREQTGTDEPAGTEDDP